MDGQALDHPLHTAMGNNGMTRMNLLGATGKTIVEEYKELFGEEAYAEFDKFEYIRIHGQEAYDEKFGELDRGDGEHGSHVIKRCSVMVS